MSSAMSSDHKTLCPACAGKMAFILKERLECKDIDCCISDIQRARESKRVLEGKVKELEDWLNETTRFLIYGKIK